MPPQSRGAAAGSGGGRMIRPSFKISMKRNEQPSGRAASSHGEEGETFYEQTTLSPRLHRREMDNLTLDRLIQSAEKMLERVSASGEAQRLTLREIMRNPDMPRILATTLDPNLLLKPRLSHFIGNGINVNFI